MSKNRRSSIIVNRGYQFSIARLAVSIVIVVINLLLLAGFFVPHWVGFEFSVTQKGAWIIAVIELLILAAVWRLSLHLSHRISGPVHAISTALDDLAQGDYSHRIVLREKDELQEIADKVNLAVAANRDRLLCISQKVSVIQNSLDQQALKDAVLDIKDIVDEFTLLEKGCDEE